MQQTPFKLIGDDMGNIERDLNSLMVIVLCGVLLSAYGVQFLWHEQPCPLCMLQRLGMLGVATGALLNIWFGSRTSHYGLSIMSAIMGSYVSLRQISLHVCPGFPTFGTPVFGISLYTWAFFVFVCSVSSISVLLVFNDWRKDKDVVPALNWLANGAFWLTFLITAANILTTLTECGVGPCEG